MNNAEMRKEELCLYIRMRNQQEYDFISVGVVKEGLQEKMHDVCDVDEVILFQCARMILDGTLLEKEYDSYWHYCLSYAYCRFREKTAVSYKEYYETCKSILRLFKDNWLGCDEEEKQCKYESALEFLEGWKAEIEKMDEPDPSLLFKDEPELLTTNSQGCKKLPGQVPTDTDKKNKSTINQHFSNIFDELQAIIKENPQEVAERVRRAEEREREASFEAWGSFLEKAAAAPPSSEGKHESDRQTKQANFRDLIQYHDKDKLLERLHYLIDNKGGALVGAVLLNAYHINPYLMRKPTRGEFESEFNLIGSWSAVYNYLDDNNPVAVEKANKIVLFPDD